MQRHAESWYQACTHHLDHTFPERVVGCVPPVVLGGDDETHVLVVCPPWRYPTSDFAKEVRTYLRSPKPTVVALWPPFEHPEGGREWFAYGPSGNCPILAQLQLDAVDAELTASLGAVRDFISALPSSFSKVSVFGSSQGASIASHVGVSMPRVERVVAFQPAGFYTDHWQPSPTTSIGVELVDAAHGELSTWRGRLGRVRPNRTVVTLFFGTRDTVAPPELVRLLQ